MGVVAVVAPERPALLGLVSTVLPVIAGGNTCVVIAERRDDPRTAIVLCECLATSDLPGGVVNVLTGQASEIAPHLAKHREVVGDRRVDRRRGRSAPRSSARAAGNVKRVRTHAPTRRRVDGSTTRAGARLHRAVPRDEDGLAPGRRLRVDFAASTASSSVNAPS